MSIDLAKAKAIFLQAAEQSSAAARQALLEEACGSDSALRQHVEMLLTAHDQAGSFLEQGALAREATLDQTPWERPGTQIGPYKLLQQIGEGGMGVVYMAEQTLPVQRRVALKLIKAGMDSGQVIARFEAERQALAIMDHPNIARVLDAGTTESGRPYFVMELVNGIPVTQFCDEQHLTTRERLELFVPICQAVQHAHQKGIIHRDLKPSNILVALYDGRPVPKVIDFGVAKATSGRLTEKTMFTGLGQMVGTLEYMSPEQAQRNQLDIDTRSDIYSLGVVLYELLTGDTPFDKRRLQSAALDELLRIIREEDPPKPSTRLSSSEALPSVAANRNIEPANLSALVRGELDWIVMKALEKDRNRRYETATSFADDVLRYLNDEPVQACPPSALYQLQKIAQRNRVGLAIAGLVLLFLVLLGTSIGWAVRDRSAREAEAAQEQAARQGKVAEQVESIFGELDRLEGEQKWPEALAAARRAEAVLAGGEADDATAQRVRRRLKELELVDRLEQIRMQQPTSFKGTTAKSAGKDPEYAQAFRDYGVDLDELAVETSIDRLKTRPALAVPRAAALDAWVSVRRTVPKADEAGWRRLVAVARGIDPDPVRDRIRALRGRPIAEVQDEIRRLVDSIDVRAQRPTTLFTLAILEGVRFSDAALLLLQDAQAAHPGDYWLNYELGFALERRKDHEGAIRFYTAAVSIRPNSAAAHNNLGNALRQLGKLDEAIRHFRESIELAPSSVAYSNLGLALRDQKKFDEAIDCFKKAIEIDPTWAGSHSNLGLSYCDLKEYSKAIACFRKAMDLDPNDPTYTRNCATWYDHFGGLLCEQKKLDEAIDAFRKAIELDPKYALAHYNLGVVLRDLNKLDDAIDAFCKAIELDPKYAPAHHNLSNALAKQGKLDEAINAYRKAIEFFPTNAECHNSLAWILATCPDARFRDARQAVALAKKATELNPQNWHYHNTLGAANYRARAWKEAIAALEKSMELRNGGDSSEWFFLAMAHWQLGEKDKAREWCDKAVEWMDKNQPTNEELLRLRAEAEELMKKE